MRKRVLAVAVLVVAVLGLIILAFVARQDPTEPSYQGKTLRQWLVLLDSAASHQAQNDAASSAIGSIGKEALPYLIHIVQQRRGPALVAKVEGWAVHFHLFRPPELELGEWQARAGTGCRILAGWNDLAIACA